MDAKAYLSRGVSPTKDDVKRAVSNQTAGEYPGAFCKIMSDFAGDPRYCSVMHADGAGTKSNVAYMMYRETQDPTWFRGIAQDALIMNLDDLACVGAVDGFYLSNTIGRNAHRVEGPCVSELIQGYEATMERLRAFGIQIEMTGGETADVGDLVRTVIVDSTVVARLPRDQIVDASQIQAGQVIIGLASFGKAGYEGRTNSGIGSNGLTAARHLLLHSMYRGKYPETYSETIPNEDVYVGGYKLSDNIPELNMPAGEALLSPTRTYLPIIRKVLETYRASVSGLIHCTGGGLVKCRDFGVQVKYVKNNLFPTPPLFEAIMDSGAIDWREMYQVFNMGHRMEVYCDPGVASQIIGISESFGVSARVVGYVEALTEPGKNQVVIEDRGLSHTY